MERDGLQAEVLVDAIIRHAQLAQRRRSGRWDLVETTARALLALDPLASAEPEEQRYQERTERFCQNLTWRRMTGEITPEYVNLAVERMFTAAELVDEIRPEDLVNLKYQICSLYFK